MNAVVLPLSRGLSRGLVGEGWDEGDFEYQRLSAFGVTLTLTLCHEYVGEGTRRDLVLTLWALTLLGAGLSFASVSALVYRRAPPEQVLLVNPTDPHPTRTPDDDNPAAHTDRPAPLPLPRRRRMGFSEDFRRFFMRGLAALLPTLITLWLVVWVWDFLWLNVGQHVVFGIRWTWMTLSNRGVISFAPPAYIGRALDDRLFGTRLMGVLIAVLLIYIVGVFVGNLLGRTLWRIAEHGVLKIPLIRAIYPAVKQITDFLLNERSGHGQFQGSRVVAVEPHEKGIWSIGLVTGTGVGPLSDATGQEMITVFVPSSPTAFSGYVLVVPKESVVELPLKVEEAMRLLVSGGVLTPAAGAATVTPAETASTRPEARAAFPPQQAAQLSQ